MNNSNYWLPPPSLPQTTTTTRLSQPPQETLPAPMEIDEKLTAAARIRSGIRRAYHENT